MQSVLIMMSTYNGHQYLKEQLDSLYRQQGVDIQILVRDDGSIDSTVKILNEYKVRYGKMTILAEHNIGVARSFFTLMTYAHDMMPKYDYYAFCDQDDVWNDDKLFIASQSLKDVQNDIKLYFCSADVVNQELVGIRVSSIPNCKLSLETSLIRNFALGCTMVFTLSLLIKSLNIKQYIESNSFDLNYLPLHDVWLYSLVFALDGEIVYDPNPRIMYRQHEHNITGSKNRIDRYSKALKRKLKSRNLRSNLALTLYRYNKESISNENIRTLLTIINYRKSIFNTVKLALMCNLKSETIIDRILWRIIILFRIF